MHPLCTSMRDLVFHFLDNKKKLKVLDVGSKDNGDNCPDFRNFFSDTPWLYVGFDLEIGKSVDLIGQSYMYPFKDNTFDGVIANQVLEHIEKPWIWIKEANRIIKKGGFVILSAPWKFKMHRFPLDCWRILPDGMKSLLEEGSFFPIVYRIEEYWTFGVGGKK